MQDCRNDVWIVYTPSRFALSTGRLMLRPFDEADVDAVLTFRGNAEVMRYVTGAGETREEVAEFLARTRAYAQQQPQTQYRFAVVMAATGRVVGGCGLDITDPEAAEGEIGYHLHRYFWGQGLGTEVAQALLHFGFKKLNLHRIFADCVADNPASARVMEKVGMRQEAHFRENKRIAGKWHDTLLYAILDREWQARAQVGE